MANRDWWRGAVIYQIYPRSFLDTNGDGIGDLSGITRHLDHVARLGADAIWLCPFFVSPQRDFGYDVASYVEVDPIFGTLADFDALLARAHALGLRVLIDQVWSHTSDRHPWFIDSRSGRTAAKADWYVWADPSADGTPPNNWLSVFGGAAWTWEPRRRQYFLHHFLSHQPALNLHNPEVMDGLLETGRFWLDRGVDGFRLDAIDFLLHDRALRSNPPAPTPETVPAKLFGMQRHVHDMLQPATVGQLARIRGLMEDYPGTVTLGEISSQPGAFERVVAFTEGADALHMAYTLRPLRGGFDWATVNALLDDLAGTGTNGWMCWSFSNHDVERAISRWNPERGEAPPNPAFGRLLMALLLSLRGSVCLYQGEELGLTEAALSEADLRDPFGIAYWPEFRGRDGSRTPMPWVAGARHGGFTVAEAPWLPVPAAHRPMAVDVQEADDASLLHAFRRFLHWRRGVPALVHGTLRRVALPEPLVGFVRYYDGQSVLAVFNLSDQPVNLDLSAFVSRSPMSGHGFEACLDGGDRLREFGVLFMKISVVTASSPMADARN
jgi:alpha-glucosidase